MSFTFEARTLLELGRELISNDEVALYELVKNSIDARSPTVELKVRCRISHTDYCEALRLLRETKTTLDDLVTFIRKKLTDEADEKSAMLIQRLSECKNRLRFEQILTRQYALLNWIIIKDSGEGMSLEDLRNVYLRIGTRSRRKENEAGATNLGDKGIGRLSSMRLGDRLRIKTSRAGEAHWNTLDIDWNQFSHEQDKLVEKIRIDPELGEEKNDDEESGTTVRINNLRADWTWVRFNELLDGQIARFVDPFRPGLANKLIQARHNGKRVLIPSIPKALKKHAHAICTARFYFDDEGDPVIEGKVDYQDKQRSTAIEMRGAEVMTVSRTTSKRRAKRGHAAFTETPISKDALRKLAGFDLEIYWYNRLIVDAIEGLTENQSASRREIRRWSGGPMLYRHGYRVLPFGEPDDDWLGLDKKAFGQSGFKLNRQQVFGRVQVETPHRFLSEQTNREGLVQSEVSDALKRLVNWIVNVEFRNFVNEVDEDEKIQFRKEELENNQILRAEGALKKAVSHLRKEMDGEHDQELSDIESTAKNLRLEAMQVLRNLDKVRKQSSEDREKFVYLAGVGLMTEFIFHELERAVGHTMSIISEMGSSPAMVTALRDQLQTLYKRISAFDELTGEKRQSKSRFDFKDLLKEVIENHGREFSRHNIDVEIDLPDGPFMVTAVRGMVIQIVENLVVNAAYWLKRQSEYEDGFEPTLTLILDEKKRQFRIQDNGPGVPTARKERIFQPFVTTKPSGMGKGLGLYIAADMAAYHDWSLKTEPEVGRLRPKRINGFILQMGK